jgi:N-acetyl-gamma-glutamyl-phosphate reductase
MHTVFHTGPDAAQPKGGAASSMPAGPTGPKGGTMLAGGSMPPVEAKRSRVAIAGATGYTGQELLRILGRHPSVSVTAAMSSGAASGAARRLPALARIWDGPITPLSAESLARDADVVFLALPDAAAAELGPSLVEAGVRVIDLSGAFRLRDATARARWYPETGRIPDGVAYGLTEQEREAVAGARLVANPGCYPTASLLALAPLVSAGILSSRADIVVDAKSGVSGAGKTPTERTHFSECHGNLSAYGVFNHRHGAEIEQGVAGPGGNVGNVDYLTFMPHLVPLDRGLMATIYVRFIRLTGSSMPEIKHVAHTNFCDIGWRVDPSGRAILVSVIDNLLKGASGQAVQNMNVMLGIDERTGLL